MGVAYMNIHVSRHLKEELAWAIDRRLQAISNLNSYTTKKLKNKAVLNIICVAMWPLVTCSN